MHTNSMLKTGRCDEYVKMIAIDIETWGAKPGYTLQPWQATTAESGILCMAFSSNNFTHLGTNLYDIQNLLSRISSTKLVCGWNLKFDLAFLIANNCIPLKNEFQFLDGMLLLKRIMPNLATYALKPTLERFADKLPQYEGVYNTEIEFKIGRNPYTKEELSALHEYNKKDAFYTYHLIDYLKTIASAADWSQAVRESSAAFLFANAWQHGIKISAKVVRDYERETTKKINTLETFFLKIELSKEVVNSPLQLRKYLSDKLHLNLTERTEKGALSVNKNILKSQSYTCDSYASKILKLILEYKTLQTETTKFIESAKNCLLESDYAHPDPILNSTYTGRVTYSMRQNIKEKKEFKNGKIKLINKQIPIGVPIHQIKRGDMRNMFVAPKGYDIVEFDFSAQEMRLMACIANERTMIDLFNSHKDLHAYTAASIVQISYDEFLTWQKIKPEDYKKMRFLGKLTNLSLQYRLSSGNLYRQWHDVYGLTDKSLVDAQVARQTYLNIYSGVAEYWQSAILKAKTLGFAQNLAGRKYYINAWNREDEWASSQTAINFPIQSTGAEQKILALDCLRNYIAEQHIIFGWDLHDGLYFYMPKCEFQHDMILDMVDIFNRLPYKTAWGWQPQIEFPVEVKLGASWGGLKKLAIN